MAELYTNVEDGIISCNACGGYTVDGKEEHVKRHSSCGGLAEVEKWERYYNESNEEETSG